MTEKKNENEIESMYPMRVWRVLHSLYLDEVLAARGDVRDWLTWLTSEQLEFKRFVLAVVDTKLLLIGYIVADDESDAWLTLSGWSPRFGWVRITVASLDEVGLGLDWIRANESLIVDNLIDEFREVEP
jgi:hypothetical protein